MNANTTNGLILSSFSMILIGVLRIIFQKVKTSECRVGGLTLKLEEIESVLNNNKNEVEQIKNMINNLSINTGNTLQEVIVEKTADV